MKGNFLFNLTINEKLGQMVAPFILWYVRTLLVWSNGIFINNLKYMYHFYG